MQIEQMETVLANYIKSRSGQVGHPIRQTVLLVNEDNGIRVGQETIEISVHLILSGANLEELVDRLVFLDDELFNKQREEKRRRIEVEKQLAKAHILELKRFCTTHEFNNFLSSFMGGEVERRSK